MFGLALEKVSNGYIVTIPPEDSDSIEVKVVVQENEGMEEKASEMSSFSSLVSFLQDYFGVYNSKHNQVGYVQGLCSERIRGRLVDIMEKSVVGKKNG